VDILIKLIMLKECATIAIINMDELKNHGIVLMISFMLQVCVKIVILTIIIEKEDNKKKAKKMVLINLMIKV
jgi:hypothetical protein